MLIPRGTIRDGNILTQKRSDQAGAQFEDLTYRYKTTNGKTLQNRLYNVQEADITNNALYTDDLEDQGPFENTAPDAQPSFFR